MQKLRREVKDMNVATVIESKQRVKTTISKISERRLV